MNERIRWTLILIVLAGWAGAARAAEEDPFAGDTPPADVPTSEAPHAKAKVPPAPAAAPSEAASEVRRASLDYETTSKAVRRFEGDILGRARRQRDETYRLFTEGERTVSDYFSAERDYNDIVRQYYDSLIRHRRGMLRLNTAVGQRILP
jgi:hypothetical protein